MDEDECTYHEPWHVWILMYGHISKYEMDMSKKKKPIKVIYDFHFMTS